MIMGWSKYAEDNFETLEERWAMRDIYSPATAYGTFFDCGRQVTGLYPQQKVNTPYTSRTVR